MARTYSTSFYPGPAFKKYLEECAPLSKSPKQSKSALIDRAIDRYRAIVAASLPPWSIEDWTQALQILQTMDLWPSSAIDVLGLVLQQGLEQRRAAGQTDATNFAYRAKTLPVPARVAVAEVVERYFKRYATITSEQLSALLAEMGAQGF